MTPEMENFVLLKVSLERRLATLLKCGTWIASLLIAAGCMLTLAASYMGPEAAAGIHGVDGVRIMTAGVALFIVLPVLRLMLMLGVFLQHRDYRFSIVTLLVLLIVLAGCAIGAHMSGAVVA